MAIGPQTRIGGGGVGGGGGGGGGYYGALLRQSGETDLGLWIEAPEAGPGWKMRASERQQEEAAELAEVVLVGVGNSPPTKTFQIPEDSVLGQPEDVNAVDIRYEVQQQATAGVKAGANFHGLRVEFATAGQAGNDHSAWLRANGHAARNAKADIEGSRGVTPDHQGVIRVTSPDSLEGATGTTIGNAPVDVGMRFTFSQGGGNGTQVVFVRATDASATDPVGFQSTGSVTAAWNGAGSILTVTLTGTTNALTNFSAGVILDAVNAARFNSVQRITATIGEGTFPLARSTTLLRVSSSSNLGRYTTTLSGGDATGGAATNRGGIRVVASAARTAGTAATYVWQIAAGRQITNTYNTVGAVPNPQDQFSWRENTSLANNTVSVSDASDVFLIEYHGTVTLGTLVDAINAGTSRFTATITQGSRADNITLSDNRSGRFTGGADATNQLSAVWDADEHRLTITALATDEFDAVRNAIIALDEFQTGTGPNAGDVALEDGAFSNDTIDVPSTVGNHVDYAFSGGVDATSLEFEEANDRLTINNVFPRVTTVQDIIDAYSGTDYELSIASGASGTDTFTIAAGPHDLTGGLDPNVDDGIDPYIWFHHADDEAGIAAGIDIYYQIGDDLADVVVRGGTYAKSDGTNASYSEATYVSTSGTQATDLAAESAQPARPVDGDNAETAGPIEAIIHTTHTRYGPHVELRYHATNDDLAAIALALTGDADVLVEEVVGTDLTENPEAVGFTPRDMLIGFGTNTQPTGQLGVDVEDEGTDIGQARTINFEGAGVSATYLGTTATVNIPGASSAVPRWATGTNYDVGQMVRDGPGRVYLVVQAINNSQAIPAIDPTHFKEINGYAGSYADRIAYPAGVLVTHSGGVYFTIAAIPSANTDDPPANSSFVRLDGGGTSITVADEGDDLPTFATKLNFTGGGVTVTGSAGEKTIDIPGGGGGDSSTNLSVDNRSGSTLDIASDTGSDATVPAATDTLAGLMTDSDKSKLDGIEARATQDQTASEIIAAIEGETDDDRLSFTALKDVPDATTDAKGLIEIASNAEEDAGTDNSKASTPAGIRRVVGPQVTSDERTAGTETSIRRFSPEDIADMVRAHSGGSSDDDIDARIRALVDAEALIANAAMRWAKTKIPNDVVYTAALNAAIAGFQTAAQVQTAIDNALAGLDAINYEGDWAAGTAYVQDDFVRNDSAWYLCIQDAAAGTNAVTEPGSGTDWETYWRRISYEDGLPAAVTGASVAGQTLTLTRNSGSNPIEVTLPSGGGATGAGTISLEEIGTWAVNVQNSSWTDTGIDIPDNVPDGELWGVRLYGGRTRDNAVQIFPASAITDSPVKSTSDSITWSQNTIDSDIAAVFTNYDLSLDFQYGLGRDNSGNILLCQNDTNVDLPADGSSSGSGGYTLELYRVKIAGSVGEPPTRAERITFQAVSQGTANNTEATPANTDPISVVVGDGDAEILSNVSGNDFDVKAGIYDIQIYGEFSSTQNGSEFFLRVQDASDNSLIVPTTAMVLQANTLFLGSTATLVLTEDTTINLSLRRVNQNSGISAGWTATFTRWGGGRDTKTTQAFDPPELDRHEFDLDGSAQDVATGITAPAAGWVFAVVNVPTAGLVGSASFMLAADLRDADQDDALTAGLYTDGDNQIILQLAAQSGASTGNEIIIFHAGTTTDDSGGSSTPTPKPTILRFTVTGEKNPAAGNIGGDEYSFDSAISQGAHVAAARIVGFTGTPVANPSSVSVLHTISDYNDETGTVSIPDPTNLAANDSYTIRLEVYAEGETTADAPSVYHDYVITARAAATATVHFGAIVGADYAAARAAIVFADDDIGDPRSAVAGTWTITGLPDDGQFYRAYFAVPTSLTQPTTFIASGTYDVTNSFDSAERTISGVDYTIYVSDDDYDNTSNLPFTVS